MKIPLEQQKDLSEINKVEDLNGVHMQDTCFRLIEEVKRLSEEILKLNSPVPHHQFDGIKDCNTLGNEQRYDKNGKDKKPYENIA